MATPLDVARIAGRKPKRRKRPPCPIDPACPVDHLTGRSRRG